MMASHPSPASLRLGGAARLSDDRVRLLEAIGRTGSITLAAQDLGLSYRAAWDAVQTLNTLFHHPLVRARPGGRLGGTAGLTAEGETALASLRHIQSELALAVQRLSERLAADGLAPLGRDPWGLLMRTSARNALRGRVTSVVDGAVESRVTLKIDHDLEIASTVSRRSARDLGLAPGVEAVALIKASLVRIAKADCEWGAKDDNVLAGTVVGLETDGGSRELIVELTEGKTLTATLAGEGQRDPDLRIGDQVSACIKASHVLLAVE